MNVSEQIPRNALFWLIGAQLALVMPLLAWLPPWTLLVVVMTAGWRLQVSRGSWSFPGRLQRALMVFLAAIAVIADFRSLLGLEPMVALLMVATSLKLLEARRLRDGYVLAMLGFFICMTVFLFDQGFLYALYILGCVALLLGALIALNQGPDNGLMRPAGTSVRLLAQALPLMVLPFLLFPRIAPLWSVPIKRHGAETGMSDTLRPGDVAKLSRDDSVAFRVKFDGATPAMNTLYWRGLTLGSFDDGTWRQHAARSQPRSGRLLVPPRLQGTALNYRIIQSPTQRPWLYGLRYALPQQASLVSTGDFRFLAPAALDYEFAYEVRSWPDALLEPELPDWRHALETRYPSGRDPKTRELVEQWLSVDSSPEGLIRKALVFFTRQPFFYTLEPTPISDQNFADAFLFETRRGFCEHFAYSFVAMMRHAGIPARIVAGYQGGELNRLNNTVIVRQLDAHAWAEVWLPERGWTRVDPTAAVSPERIELGVVGALQGDSVLFADSPLSALRFNEFGIVNWLRLRYDALGWRWQNFVVGFGGDTQVDVLKRLLGDITAPRLMLFLLGGSVVILAPGVWLLLRPRRGERLLPAERDFKKLCAQLARRGLHRQAGEAPRTYIDRVKPLVGIDERKLLEQRFADIEARLYAPEAAESKT